MVAMPTFDFDNDNTNTVIGIYYMHMDNVETKKEALIKIY